MLGEILSGGVSLLGSLFGGGGGDGGAAASHAAAVAAIQALKIPEVDKAILLNQFQQSGTISPELLQKLSLNLDEQQKLEENPENRLKQEAALSALKQLSQTGMSPQDLAQMQQMRSQVAQDTNAKQAQILQQAQMRGQLSGGDTLAAQLMANQANTQASSKGAIDAAAQAAAARREALNNYSNLAGQVRGQDFNTANVNNQNELLRKQFLDENAISRQQQNVANKNNANLYNLQRQQAVSDQNTSQANDELRRQVEAKKWMAEMEFRKAAGAAGQFGSLANFQSSSAANDAANTQKIYSGAGQVLGNAGTEIFGTKDPKTGSKSWYFSQGGRVPGEADLPGDNILNDEINAKLSPEEIVIPRSKAKDPKKAKSFVDDVFDSEKKEKKFDKNEALLNLIAELHSKKK
jgi:hypothetical protein